VELSQAIVPLLYVYALFRGIDLYTHTGPTYLLMWRQETLLFWFEIALFVIVPIILLGQESVRQNPQALYWTCALVVMGFITNRLNLAVTAFERSSGFYYVPKWTEFALTLATVTACAVAFHYAVTHLDILPKNAPAKNFAVTNVATA